MESYQKIKNQSYFMLCALAKNVNKINEEDLNKLNEYMLFYFQLITPIIHTDIEKIKEIKMMYRKYKDEKEPNI